ncbi:exported hypothetical protein [Bradyrhizobium oligotrophicum S58]|uniref:Uncharacterized protein n=1 Tax=Bradyrhizobium oligotrophicum S58 TaxID=1245469 RepID=M4Z8Q3_9BRAD|nr:hypothetical protein [Bradyrhizobium oligotrophicum]BAM89792.1 exported hypothetical protein [Bradyrhizobium oligotrophicum S58]
MTGAYPDPMLTRGAIDSRLTPKYICSHSTSERRSVSTAQKKEIFAAYGVPFKDRARYEVDHFIPLSLGGVNTCTNPDESEDVTCNLWPEPHQKSFRRIAPWGSETKDKLENRLYRLMCAGQISLEEARSAITSDWEEGYRQYVESPAVAAVARPFMAPVFPAMAPAFTAAAEPTASPHAVGPRHHRRADRAGQRPVGSPDEIALPRFDFHEFFVAPPQPVARPVRHQRKHRTVRH